MNDTQPLDTPAADSGENPQHGPRVSRDEMLDVERLRRSSTDRYIAGVAGGLGRHFDVDPLLFRIAFVGLTFVGGAGLLLYVAAWLFIPEDNADNSTVKLNPEVRRFTVIGSLALAALIVVGDFMTGSNWTGWPIALLLLSVLIVMALRRPKATPAKSTWAYADGAWTETAADGTVKASYPAVGAAAPPGAGGPNGGGHHYYDPAGAPQSWMRPRRTGMLLFFPTLALIAIGIGSLAIYDANHAVADGAYAALALAIVGAMLAIGAFVGRPGGLILLGLIAVPALLATSVIGNRIEDGSIDQVYRPTSLSELRSDYSYSTGDIELDLSALSGPGQRAGLDGRTITVHMDAGHVQVLLPAGIRYHLDSHLSFAGAIRADGNQTGGPGVSLSHTAGNGPELRLDIDGKAGYIEVIQVGEPAGLAS